jgi:quinolinate synthase
MTAANAAIVAHYYMDVELQSVLNALPSKERVFIADSLAMGDAAVRMCEDGAEAVICLGVDFMSESVKSIMSKNGYGHIPVLRSTAKKIGCSLAESAERLSYGAWLTKAKQESANPLHVIYINTSLETKALSSQIIPTVTCTSSNVLKTMLTASLQMEDVSIYYGPDTFMGENLRTMFQKVLANWSDDDIKHKLHPDHDRASIQKLMDNLHVFPNGNCVVHHMFNKSCVDTVINNYPEAYVSAHLEVPGEMFEIAMEKSLSDEGNVGSTSDILNFIARKVKEEGDALAASGEVPAEKKQLQFILGTEAGMVTSIVTAVQKILSSNPVASKYLAAEIVFPVANDAVMVDETSEFGVVPGVSSGEGCSTAGGCATCPFMKMNDLDSVVDICDTIAAGNIASLSDYAPPNRLEGKMIGDRQAVDVGVDSIMHMRDLMGTGKFGEGLVNQVMGGGRK